MIGTTMRTDDSTVGHLNFVRDGDNQNDEVNPTLVVNKDVRLIIQEDTLTAEDESFNRGRKICSSKCFNFCLSGMELLSRCIVY